MMSRVYLEHMVEAILDDPLPEKWRGLDLETFSQEKHLWDYQQRALHNALKLLWKFYEDFGGLSFRCRFKRQRRAQAKTLAVVSG